MIRQSVDPRFPVKILVLRVQSTVHNPPFTTTRENTHLTNFNTEIQSSTYLNVSCVGCNDQLQIGDHKFHFEYYWAVAATCMHACRQCLLNVKKNCHNDWQFVISDLDEWTQFITAWRRTTWQSFPHSQPTFLRIIIPSWQLTVSMHQIGSLICNEHDKLNGQNYNSIYGIIDHTGNTCTAQSNTAMCAILRAEMCVKGEKAM